MSCSAWKTSRAGARTRQSRSKTKVRGPREPALTAYGLAAGGVLVGDLERLVEDGEALANLGLGRRARRDHMGAVEVHERPEPSLLARRRELGHGTGRGARGVEGHERLAGLAVLDQLQ